MCGILGLFNQGNTGFNLLKGLKIIESRGGDGCGFVTENELVHKNNLGELIIRSFDNNIMGHVLHSIVSKVFQPVKTRMKNKLVINCEIYNWRELAKKYNVRAVNDVELALKLIEQKGISIIEEFDGVFALAYWSGRDNKLYLARDLLGVKPLFFSNMKGFSFASERKVLKRLNKEVVEELNPREVLIYDIKTKRLFRRKRKFFRIKPEHKSKKKIVLEVERLLKTAIRKRIPNRKIKLGILFSGGIDSTILAYIMKKENVDFTCYTAVLDHPDFKQPEDLIYSKRIAEEVGFKLKIVKIKLAEVEPLLKETIELIEDTQVTKVGVGVTFLAAAKEARKDGIKVLFSGLGSEEIFGGYERHRQSSNINKECVSGLLKMYERDLYRDDVITMHNSIELRLPFLDKELVDYALKIPSSLKIQDCNNILRVKAVLRDFALKIGISSEFVERRKLAAQYGSKFHRAIEKLAKTKGYSSKAEYLGTFVNNKNLNLGVLFSGGKDSVYAMHVMKEQNYEISCLITIKSRNDYSYMFHTPAINLVELQAKSLKIPLVIQETEGEKEKELEDLKKAIKTAKKEYNIEGIITGALFSEYQRKRIEKICDSLNLKIFNPLWHMDQEKEMKNLIQEGFDIIMSSVAAFQLNKDWIGRKIDLEKLGQLVKLNKKIGFNIAGEGGEFETLVLDGPGFTKKIVLEDYTISEEDENTARLIVKKAILKNKE